MAKKKKIKTEKDVSIHVELEYTQVQRRKTKETIEIHHNVILTLNIKRALKYLLSPKLETASVNWNNFTLQSKTI